MGILRRSKSAAPTTQKPHNKRPDTATECLEESAPEGKAVTSDSSERPRTGDQRKSFSRPRTANATLQRCVTEPQSPSYRIDFKAGTEIYSFPTPSALPPQHATGSSSSSDSPMYELPAIGVAIGSPTYKKQRTGPVVVEPASSGVPAPPSPAYCSFEIPSRPDFDIILKRKKSAWKTIGKLFVRKAQKTRTEDPAKTPFVLDLPAGSSKPAIAVQTGGWSPMFRSLQKVVNEGQDDVRNDSPLELVDTSASYHTMHLNCDIPDSKLDRYSVMFEKQLNDPRPSLLERRKSKLQRSQSVQRLNLAPPLPKEQQDTSRLNAYAIPQRSVTSPGLTSSFSDRIERKVLSAFRERFASIHGRPSPPKRIERAPTRISSPPHPAFPQPSIAIQSPSLIHLAQQPQNLPPTSPVYPPALLPPPLTPLTSTTFHTFTTLSSTSPRDSLIRSLDETEADWCATENNNNSSNDSPRPTRPRTEPGYYKLAQEVHVRLSCVSGTATATATATKTSTTGSNEFQFRASSAVFPAKSFVARPRVVVLGSAGGSGNGRGHGRARSRFGVMEGMEGEGEKRGFGDGDGEKWEKEENVGCGRDGKRVEGYGRDGQYW